VLSSTGFASNLNLLTGALDPLGKRAAARTRSSPASPRPFFATGEDPAKALGSAPHEIFLTYLCLTSMFLCMRTTIDIPDDLLAKAKRIAAESRRPLRAVIEDALREALTRRRRSAKCNPVSLPTFRGGGLRPGVDLDDTASLLDLMDAAGDPRRR